jgi:hypothetical protein
MLCIIHTDIFKLQEAFIFFHFVFIFKIHEFSWALIMVLNLNSPWNYFLLIKCAEPTNWLTALITIKEYLMFPQSILIHNFAKIAIWDILALKPSCLRHFVVFIAHRNDIEPKILLNLIDFCLIGLSQFIFNCFYAVMTITNSVQNFTILAFFFSIWANLKMFYNFFTWAFS